MVVDHQKEEEYKKYCRTQRGTFIVSDGGPRGKKCPQKNVGTRRGTYFVRKGILRGKCIPNRVYKQDRVIMKEV